MSDATTPRRPGAARHRSGGRPIGRAPADQPGLITNRAAARLCHVSPRMIDRWIDTGLWPLPLSNCREVLLFKKADVECWLGTGAWSGHFHFHDRLAGRRLRGRVRQSTRPGAHT
jgi:hypothetical protein